MRIQFFSSTSIAVTVLLFLAACESGGSGQLRERFDEKSGKMVQEYVMPCYVTRIQQPWGPPIKKIGPQPNGIRFVDGGVRAAKDTDACFKIDSDGNLTHTEGYCPQIRIVSPEMCEDK